MPHSSEPHPSPTLSEFLKLLQNKWTFRVACQNECDSLGPCVCLRHIVHVEALEEWWKQTDRSQRLLNELGPAEGELVPFNIKVLFGQHPCLKVFSLLLKQGHGLLLVGFRAAGIDDRTFEDEAKDNDSRLRIELERLSTCSDVDRVIEDFQKERWAYCPPKLEMNMDVHLQNTKIIPPFCHKIKLGEKGGTASIYWVTVQKDLISDESLKNAIQETLYTDKDYGDCYQMVLKSYHGDYQSAYDLEKKAFSGLKHNGSVPIVGCFGCYTHEYGEGTNAGKAYNLLLEYGERDLYEHWED
ncbi:hypothetical protein J4E85_005563 [Alternaria conjuncta]|uniref:uncharacterized protein n=1 Tax=Alternaria conjuncta TaxID=181017 RepID=UPI00221E9769|nr:uncharacterized protein J4E85_005563 [Alternaria conjuncta]KAI4928941.1 hypothetical protein J4E85_005563 [Alternaria conjuncta]